MTAHGAVLATVLVGFCFFRRTSADGLAGTTCPFLSSSASSRAASAVNSSVTCTPSSGSSDVILDTGKEYDARNGSSSSDLMGGERVSLRLVGLFLVLVAVKDLRDREADLRRSAPDGGLEPD